MDEFSFDDCFGLEIPSTGAEFDDDAPLCAVVIPESPQCASMARPTSVEPLDADTGTPNDTGLEVGMGNFGFCASPGSISSLPTLFLHRVRSMDEFSFDGRFGGLAAGCNGGGTGTPNDTGFEVGVGNFCFVASPGSWLGGSRLDIPSPPTLFLDSVPFCW